MKKLFTLIWILVCAVSFANNDKYRLILVSDPATSITIGWNQTSGSSPVVHYGTTDFGTVHTSYPFSKSVDRSVTSRGMSNQFVRLTGLTPNTNYYFVINDSQGTSQRLWFKTAPDDTSRLSFIAGGDSRNNRAPRQDANRIVAKLKPHAVLFGGDMTNGDSSGEWQDWMDDWQLTTTSDGRMFPIVPAVGNHEGSTVIYELFDTPDNNSYYALTFGDNMYRAYTLNTNISVTGNQLTWLENDLSNNLSARWRAAQYHKPMRPHESGKSEGEAHYQAWAELFYESGVRLVVDCDSHTVKTTWPLKPSSGAGNDEGFIREDIYGTVYAGEGCWGAPLRANDDNKAWTRNSGSFNQFKLIYVGLNEIELRTVLVDEENSIPNLAHNDPFGLTDSSSYLWNPSEGMVVTIDYIDLPSTPEIAFMDGTSKDFIDGTNVTLDIDVLDDGGGITQVEFFVDGISNGTDTTAPYGFTNTYTNGAYSIEAIATNLASRTHVTEININVGTFTTGDTIFIADGNDDVEEAESDGSVYFNSTDLEFFDDGGWQKVGLRFQKINIPKGAVINSAAIRFKSDAADNQNGMNFRIYIEDSGDATPFENNSSGNVSARDKYATFVDWAVNDWFDGERGPNTTSDDLAALLQGVIDRCDWKQGNNIAFIFERTGPNSNSTTIERRADTYEQNPPDAAQISFNYTYNTLAPVGVTKFVSNAWTNGVPDSSSTVIIEDNYDTSTNGGSITACNIVVTSGRTLTIAPGDFLNIDGNITVDAGSTIIVEHEGSLVQLNDDAVVKNEGAINVKIDTPQMSGRDFMLMGSPMSSETRADAFGGALRVRNHLTGNFTPNAAVAATSPGAGNWLDEEGDDWPVHSGAINAGEGYMVMQSVSGGPTSYSMTYDQGTLNNGLITYNATYNGSQNASPSIIANPYASAISATDFINGNANVDAVYFWEHVTTPTTGNPGPYGLDYTMEDISIFNLTGGTSAAGSDVSTTPNGIISTGQGFGVKVTSAGDITFNNAMRRTTGNTTLRSTPTTDRDRIWLNVQADRYELNGTALIGFMNEATDGIDVGYDSRRLANNVSLYSHLADGSEQLGIQARGAFQENVKIPMGFSTLVDETISYTISIENLEGSNLSNQTVYLIDNQEQTVTNLSDTNYTFESGKGIFDGRFTLQFTPETILGSNDVNLDSIAIYPNPTQNILNIVSPKAAVTAVEVYDVRGRVVMSTSSFNSNGATQIDLSELNSAMYFVKISTEAGQTTKRVLKR